MTADQNAASRRWATLRFAAPLAVLAAAIAVGYLGFRTFVTAPALDSLALPILAIAAGVASFFSPCAFPLLPGYLSFSSPTGGAGEARPRGQGSGGAGGGGGGRGAPGAPPRARAGASSRGPGMRGPT